MTLQNPLPDQKQSSIHPATLIGHLALTVNDLENQVAFYRQVLGFKLHWREDNRAGLGAGGADLLRLVEQKGVQHYYRVTGLYHFAVLFPNRRELARAVARLFALRYPNAPTDHIMTKTTYLDDPEFNGIELYAESPEDGFFGMEGGRFIARRADGTMSDGREPLDVEALLRELADDDRLDLSVPPETRIGHIHLHVANVDEAVDFYHGIIGFDVMGVAKAFHAAFVSAGGYHHHVGLNTWQGEDAPPPPDNAAGLRYFTVELPTQAALDPVLERVRRAGLPIEQTPDGMLVRDPSQNAVILAVAHSS